MMKTVMMAVAMAIVLCGSSGNGHVSIVSADPIGPPDLSSCPVDDLPPDCCLPAGSASTFIPLNDSTPLRTRRALQNVLQNATYLASLSAAYARLRSIERENSTDPRGFEQQRRLHCAFCAEPIYGRPYSMHNNWFFLPWHRMLLFYHERILAWAVGDPDFALPFWNWDSNDTAHTALPAPYANTTSALYTAGRIAADEIQREIERNITTDQQYREFGDVTGWHNVVGNATHGGSFETYGHNGVHNFVGGDMLNTRTAANDPVFYVHHANVDRMWSVWRQLPDRSDPESTDFLNSRFVFYDENAIARVIAVSEVLDHRTNLRYVYENVDDAWTRPPVGTSRTFALSSSLPPLKDPRTFRASVTVSAANVNVATAFVESPQTTVRRGALPELTLRNVAHSPDEPLALYVFIDEPQAGTNTTRAGNPRYVGARFLLAGGLSMPVSFTLPLRIVLDELSLSLSSSFNATVVRGVQFGAPTSAWSIESIDYVHDPPV